MNIRARVPDVVCQATGAAEGGTVGHPQPTAALTTWTFGTCGNGARPRCAWELGGLKEVGMSRSRLRKTASSTRWAGRCARKGANQRVFGCSFIYPMGPGGQDLQMRRPCRRPSDYNDATFSGPRRPGQS